MIGAERIIKLVLEYDGGAYAGWQRQKGIVTIQEVIETALRTMLHEPVTLHGSGRTDAGVHATGQVAHFVTAATYEAGVFQNALNALLPPDIAVKEASEAPSGFHARYSVQSKRYHYLICNRFVRPALMRDRAWHVRVPLDLEAMAGALESIEGTHDFSAFQSAGSCAKSPVRTIFQQSLSEDANGMVCVALKADGFLRHMVRNTVGTLVQVGGHAITPSDFTRVLTGKDRSRAGPKAPPQGLYLVEVEYGQHSD
ncbi:MAG: tRNA pseudouridine(38-40) synthase TruA [Deltaproteobacteria bacterium]|nr:tRNA pseudouridine(38-40) synthase TruA [Deltaproteobacteria bacterium]